MSAPQQPPPSPAAASSSPVSSEPDRLEKIAKYLGWAKGTIYVLCTVGIALVVAGWRVHGELDSFAKRSEVESAIRGVNEEQKTAASVVNDHEKRLIRLETRWDEIQRALNDIHEDVRFLRTKGGAP